MRRSTSVLVAICGLLLMVGSGFAQSFTFTRIDVPCAGCPGGVARHTVAYGINPAGDIVGSYTDSTGFQHGFLLSGGTFTKIDVPGTLENVEGVLPTTIRAIGPGGTLAGNYFAPPGSSPQCTVAGSAPCIKGFVYDHGSFSTFLFPGHLGSIVEGITPNGDLYGCYHDFDFGASMHGFTRTRAGYSDIGLPASMDNGATPDGKTVIGFYTDLATRLSHGYVLENGNLQIFDVPNSVYTEAMAINPSGVIVGLVKLVENGAVRTHGFIRTASGYTIVDYPNAVSTTTTGVNATGVIAGQYTDAQGQTHGFTAVPTDN